MRKPQPVTLNGRHVRLEPLHADHEPELRAAAADGELWRLRVTSVPAPDEVAAYIAAALMGLRPLSPLRAALTGWSVAIVAVSAPWGPAAALPVIST